ncbi:uncharacterized protein B0T15DRAFT_543200 [Chaetomium strumarium]|uniref:NCT transcriptional regulatory complex subunit A n=1 Tax=Chaetomium strumarium TaxID=1170767 RepID=A0AAJ0GM84_9PEZI|nr:hypothetical protein B0T15DRAFT_543200 [Chaetomium strumarium]
MSDDGTYAPKSPDLSSFYSAGPTPPAEPASESGQLFSKHSQSNISSIYNFQAHAPHEQGQNYATPPRSLAHARSTYGSNTSEAPGFVGGVEYSQPAKHEYYYPPRAQSYPGPGYSQAGPGYTAGYTATQFPQPQRQTFSQSSSQYQYQQVEHQPFPVQTSQFTAAQSQVRQHYDNTLPSTGQRQPGGQVQHDFVSYHPDTMPPRRAAAAAAAAAVTSQTASEAIPDIKHEAAGSAVPSASTSTSTTVEPGQVRTKFPTARIKRIMQADEEVGKVAQQTPIAVGKALELFMVALVTKSAEVAKQRNSKRVSAQMLKQVVEADDQWDFLREIVSKVETEEKGGKASSSGAAGQSASSKVKAESESEEEGGDGVPKRRGRGGGRKKKDQ